jgi:tetratricopeptide (TPR) repeat protein
MASEGAVQALAFEDALRYLEKARSLLADVDNSRHARVLRLRALALRGMGRADEALSTFGQALPLAPAGPERNCILYSRAELHLDLFYEREAMEDLEVLRDRAHQSEDRPMEMKVMLDLGRAHYILSLDDASFVQATRESYERLYALSRELDDRHTMAKVLALTAWLTDNIDGYREQATKNATEAVSIAERLGDEDLQIDCSLASTPSRTGSGGGRAPIPAPEAAGRSDPTQGKLLQAYVALLDTSRVRALHRNLRRGNRTGCSACL